MFPGVIPETFSISWPLFQYSKHWRYEENQLTIHYSFQWNKEQADEKTAWH